MRNRPPDPACLWKFGLYYGWSAGAAALGAWYLPAPFGWGVLAAAVAAAWLTLRDYLRWHRSEIRLLRRALVALIAERIPQAEVWLNRDEHLVFQVMSGGPAWFRRWGVFRLPENVLLEIAGDGEGFAGYELFRCLPVEPQVYREQDGVIFATARDGEPVVTLPPGPRFPVRVWRHSRMERTGLLYAGADEIRALMSQLREAEPARYSQGKD